VRDVVSRHATSTPSYPERVRMPRHQDTPRSEAGAITTVHLRLMTRAGGLGQCHAASPHSLAGEPPSAIGRRASARRRRLRAHAIAPVGHEARAKPPRRVVGPMKPLPLLSSRAPEQHRSLPPPAISGAGELAPPLALVTIPRP
jgi:hypothetical protein